MEGFGGESGEGSLGFHAGVRGVCHPQIWEHDLGALQGLVNSGSLYLNQWIEVRRYKGSGRDKRPTADGPYRVRDLIAVANNGGSYRHLREG